jgi:hypothetical protein
MRQDPPVTRIHRMRIVLGDRERRAHIALQRGMAAHAEAAAELTQINRALALQAAARGARERQIYQRMVGRSLSAREITEIDAQLSQLERLAIGLAEQRLASIRALDAAHKEVQGGRLQLAEAYRKRRKWDELSQRLGRRREDREVLIDELAGSDGRVAGRRS